MYEERESDKPDWEIEEEKIPESLRRKWQKEEEKGLRAGVCPSCGNPFTQEDLSCRHCGARANLPQAPPHTLRKWFLGTPIGIVLFLIILSAIVIYLVR